MWCSVLIHMTSNSTFISHNCGALNCSAEKKNCVLFWLWRRRREREIVAHCFISWMHSNQIISIIKERPKIKCNTGQNDFLIRDQMLQLLCAVTLVYQCSEWQANDDDVQPWEQQERFKKKKKMTNTKKCWLYLRTSWSITSCKNVLNAAAFGWFRDTKLHLFLIEQYLN